MWAARRSPHDGGLQAIRPATTQERQEGRARSDSGASGGCHFAPDAVAIRTRYVRGVSAVTQVRPRTRHGPALAYETHIHGPCPRRRARFPGSLPRGRPAAARSASRMRNRSASRGLRRRSRISIRRSAWSRSSSAPNGAPSCAAGVARHSPPSPAASPWRRSRRSAPASPAGTRRRFPPTGATAANTSSTTAPGNRSAGPATRPPPPEREQDYRAALLYSQSGSSPWPVCG